jgi:uncharacterized protein (TIGR00290 family)
VTGDITLVDGYPNWIRECGRKSGIEVLTPLWGRDRSKLLYQLISSGFDVIFSLVKKPWFSDEWVGRRIDLDAVRELKELSRKTGLDICGENGEYHTLVLNAPYFKERLQLDSYSILTKDGLAYLALTQ